MGSGGSYRISIGGNATAEGLVRISGGTMILGDPDGDGDVRHVRVGHNGDGTLEVEGSAVFETRTDLTIGVNAGSSGAVNLEGGRLTVDGTLTIGRDATAAATLTQTSGFLEVKGGITHPGAGSHTFTGGTLSTPLYNGNLTNNGGVLAPGDSAGQTVIVGNYTQGASGKLEIELGGTTGGTFDSVFASGSAALDGTVLVRYLPGFAASPSNSFAIVIAGSLSPTAGLDFVWPDEHDWSAQAAGNTLTLTAGPITYDSWGSFHGLADPAAEINLDPNGDGVSNGMAFVYGAPSPSESMSNAIPTMTVDAAHVEFVFQRSDTAAAAPGATILAEYGSSLASWNPAQHGVSGVTVTVQDDAIAPGIDRVLVRIPRALAMDRRLFVRLGASL